MSIKTGVWIDHHKAVLVRLTSDGEEISQIDSRVEKPFSSSAGSGADVAEHPQNHLSESKQERKYTSQLNGFYDEVLKALHDADPVLILGPGEAKGEFQKRLQKNHFPAHVVEFATADKMTDPQLAAKVRKQFEALKSRN